MGGEGTRYARHSPTKYAIANLANGTFVAFSSLRSSPLTGKRGNPPRLAPWRKRRIIAYFLAHHRRDSFVSPRSSVATAAL